jgi:hypothetical protein
MAAVNSSATLTTIQRRGGVAMWISPSHVS